MKKVAILYESLGRSRGGIEAWIYHACEELLRQGHEVTVFNAQVQTPEDAVPLGVRVESLRIPRHVPAFTHWVNAGSYRKQLETILGQYDAVWQRSFTMAWAAGKILNHRKPVYINAAPFPFYGRIPFRDAMKAARGIGGIARVFVAEISLACAWILEKKAIELCTNVYLSTTRRDETIAYYNLTMDSRYFHVVPAGVNLGRFFPAESGWSGQGPLRLITVCRLAPDKNIQCVILALARLIEKGVSVILTIVGEGKYDAALKQLVQELNVGEYVQFAGRQDNIEQWYRKNHVFVLPSLYEGFGSVYVEAMASGLPCIAVSRASGKYSVAADEIIDHEINGFLMKDNDPAELVEYLHRLYKSPEMWNALSKAARSKVQTKYRWESVVERLLEISRSVIASAKL